MKHKWYDVIVAWAEGKDIQFKNVKYKTWIDVSLYEGRESPNFNASNIEWRIKPSCYKYRMVLEYSSLSKRYWVTVTDDPTIESREFFVRYLTDWMEIELLPDERDISVGGWKFL